MSIRRARRLDRLSRRRRSAAPVRLRRGGAYDAGDFVDVDLYAGGGGASEALRLATETIDADGKSPDIAIDHWPTAIRMHEINHPGCVHYAEDVRAVDPLTATGGEWRCVREHGPLRTRGIRKYGRRVRVLWASPTCFPAGTLVLTRTGMRSIAEVQVGTLVLTHKGRWRKVTAVTSKESETVVVRGQGHYGIETTPDHPFYSKHITKRWPSGDGERRPGLVRELVENPYWPRADSMAGKLWATPTRFGEASIPMCQTASLSDDFFYFLGRWVGDGYTSKGDVCICTGAADFNAMRTIFNSQPLRDEHNEVIKPRVQAEDAPAPKLVWGNAGLARWLDENFGSGCDDKSIPTWLLSAQDSWKRAFLAGYVDADGHVRDGLTSTTSVSRSLAIGVRLLVASLGYTPCLYRAAGRMGQIDGREIIGKDSFRVDWRVDNQKETSFHDSDHLFTFAKKVTRTGITKTVHCLQVDEDESYVADGIVVHNCTHFSRAKGASLLDRKIRGLAWMIMPWIKLCRPDFVCMENVKEFLGWGPLHSDHSTTCDGDHADFRKGCRLGTPIKERAGETFRAFERRVRSFGYSFEWVCLPAWQFGVATMRDRWYCVMRRDGAKQVWPTPTHTRDNWKPAGEIIDWSIPCPSILDRAKPHVEATRARLALGLVKYVLTAAKPYLVHLTHGTRDHSIDEPTPTITCANRGELAVVRPAFAVHTGNGEREGQEPRTYDLNAPTNTATAEGVKYAPVAAFVSKAFSATSPGNVMASSLAEPLSTVTAVDHNYVVAASLVKFYGTSTGAPLEDPSPVVTAQGQHLGISAAYVVQYNGESIGHAMTQPLGAVTTRDRFALVEATADTWDDVKHAKARRVHRLLVEHGQFGPWLDHANEVVRIPGTDLVVYDLRMRILVPRESFNAQGFSREYVIDFMRPDGKLVTKTEQTRAAGNSVCPPVAAAIIRAVLAQRPANSNRSAPRKRQLELRLEAA